MRVYMLINQDIDFIKLQKLCTHLAKITNDFDFKIELKVDNLTNAKIIIPLVTSSHKRNGEQQ